MSVVTKKSAPLTAADAIPSVNQPNRVLNGRLNEDVGVVAIASGDTSASIYRAVRVKSSDRVSQVLLTAPDIGTTTIADVGVYRTEADGGAVVDADFFGSAVSLKDGAIANSDITYESGAYTAANSEKALWEALGLSLDPHVYYDIALTLTGDADAAGSVAVKVRVNNGN